MDATHAPGLPDPDQLEAILDRQMLLRELRASGKSREAFAREKGISRTTLWHYERRAARGALALLDGRRGRSGRRVEIDAPAAAALLTLLAEHPGAKVRALHGLLEAKAKAEGWARRPSYDQVLRFVRRLDPEVEAAIRRGPRARFEELGAVTNRVEGELNALWQLDIEEVPVWTLLLEEGRLTKPYLTVFMEAASRPVLSWRLTAGHPDSREVLATFKEGVLPKGDPTRPFYGRPRRVRHDKHQVFKGDFLEGLLALDVEPDPSPAYCPSANGKVERVFKRFKDQLWGVLDGYAHQFKGLERAAAQPIPFPVLERIIGRFLLTYHTEPHRGVGMGSLSPWERWHELLPGAHGLVFSQDEVEEALTVRRELVVQRNGVEIAPGRFYTSADLAPFVGETVTLKVPPEGGLPRRARAYYQGRLIGELRSAEEDAELANQISGERRERGADLGRLRRTLLEIADRGKPGPPPVKQPQRPAAAEEEEADMRGEPRSGRRPGAGGQAPGAVPRFEGHLRGGEDTTPVAVLSPEPERDTALPAVPPPDKLPPSPAVPAAEPVES